MSDHEQALDPRPVRIRYDDGAEYAVHPRRDPAGAVSETAGHVARRIHPAAMIVAYADGTRYPHPTDREKATLPAWTDEPDDTPTGPTSLVGPAAGATAANPSVDDEATRRAAEEAKRQAEDEAKRQAAEANADEGTDATDQQGT